MRVLAVATFAMAAAGVRVIKRRGDVTLNEPKPMKDEPEFYKRCKEMEDGAERCETDRPEFYKKCKTAEDGVKLCLLCVKTEQGEACKPLDMHEKPTPKEVTDEVVVADSCISCLNGGGGAGCLDRCGGKSSDCRSCVQYGGGAGCVGRCGGGGGGGGNVNLDIPYFYQYNNARFPGSSCQNTVIAMSLKWRGWNGNPDIITQKWGKDYAQSPAGFSDLLTTEAKNQGIRISSRARTSATLSDLKRFLDQGKPVPIHGYFTGYGHVVMVVGYSSGGYYVNDPAGRWSQQFKGGYGGSSSSTVGKGIYYGKAAFEAAVATSNGYSTIPLWIHELSTW